MVGGKFSLEIFLFFQNTTAYLSLPYTHGISIYRLTNFTSQGFFFKCIIFDEVVLVQYYAYIQAEPHQYSRAYYSLYLFIWKCGRSYTHTVNSILYTLHTFKRKIFLVKRATPPTISISTKLTIYTTHTHTHTQRMVSMINKCTNTTKALQKARRACGKFKYRSGIPLHMKFMVSFQLYQLCFWS